MGFRLRRSGQLGLLAACLIVGILAQWQTGSWRDAVLAASAIGVVALVRGRVAVLAVLMLLLGAWRAAVTDFAASPLGRQVGKPVVLSGEVSDDPAINDKNQAAFTLATRDGNLRVYSAGYLELQRGYQVQVAGKLSVGRGAVPATISYAQVAVLSRHQSDLEAGRQRFMAALHQALPEPLSGFMLGLLIGSRAMIDQQLQSTLNAIGLSHLIAVSGYNLTIIIRAVRRLLGSTSLFISTAASLWLVWVFLLVTGFSASIVRAAIVSVLSLWTGFYGYDVKPLSLIALPALITLAWNPDYLVRDIGWQLSFLAFFGIIVVAPVAERRLVKRHNAVTSLLVESLAAQALTAPLIFWVFGNTSLLSPVANMLILPLVPAAMLGGLLVSGIGMVSPDLAAWLGLPVGGLMALIVGVIQWLGSLRI